MRQNASRALVGVLIACSVAIVSLLDQKRRARKQLSEARRQLEAEKRNRAAERTGRIRAEKKLREREGSREHSDSSRSHDTYPLQPIGHLNSCFNKRSGTPRQPLLVPAARAKLTLRQDVPAGCLEGLEQYSHVWLLYIFHCNTDLQRLWSPEHASDGLKAKVQVPRLNGQRMGVLATRSPHRPSPIGLSVAQVVEVKGRCVILGGADIVDGSPILDIKPYLPFCDSLSHATAPHWVSDEASNDPIALKDVSISIEVMADLKACWAAPGPGSALRQALYKCPEDWVDLVRQVLRLDIRSLHQRTSMQGKHPGAGSIHCGDSDSLQEAARTGRQCSSDSYNLDEGSKSQSMKHASTQLQPESQTHLAVTEEQLSKPASDMTAGKYRVTLQGITVSYDVLPNRTVLIRGSKMG